MKLLSDQQAIDWCGHRAIKGSGALPSAFLSFDEPTSRSFRVRLPTDAPAIVGFAYQLLMTDVPDFEESRFVDGMVWLRRWELWSESIDHAGYALLDGLRTRSAHSTPLDSAPAHLFSANEFTPAHACLALIMLFQWDGFFIPGDGRFFAFLSNDGYVDLHARDQAGHAALLERFRALEPTELSPQS